MTMGNSEVRYSESAWRQILLDPQLQRELDRHGEAIADACNDALPGSDEGYKYLPPSRNLRRDRGIVVAESIHARYDNAKRHTLIRKMRTLPS